MSASPSWSVGGHTDRRSTGPDRGLESYGAKARTGRTRVLVVDDEKVLTDSTVRILEARGYPARGAYDAASGLAEAERWRPSVVIMDVAMPGMDGIEAAVRLRAMLGETRILLISGQAETVDLLQQARTRGQQFEILAKPVAPLELLAKIASIR
ncbi:MAG: response regulator [Terriglobales bacterium]